MYFIIESNKQTYIQINTRVDYNVKLTVAKQNSNNNNNKNFDWKN
jgi:hypothetical protein